MKRSQTLYEWIAQNRNIHRVSYEANNHFLECPTLDLAYSKDAGRKEFTKLQEQLEARGLALEETSVEIGSKDRLVLIFPVQDSQKYKRGAKEIEETRKRLKRDGKLKSSLDED